MEEISQNMEQIYREKSLGKHTWKTIPREIFGKEDNNHTHKNGG